MIVEFQMSNISVQIHSAVAWGGPGDPGSFLPPPPEKKIAKNLVQNINSRTLTMLTYFWIQLNVASLALWLVLFYFIFLVPFL